MVEQTGRCVNCRSDVSVPDRYAHGDHIKCGSCGTQHKVLRDGVVRLVLADPAPLRDALRETQQRISTLNAELKQARASFGIGANGIGVGLIYVLYEVGLQDAPLSADLFEAAALIAVGSAALLELFNYLFLAKRKAISRFSAEIATLEDECRQLQQKIRDASRR